MIVLFNPRSTKPRNRRLPLSVLALAAVLEGREEYRIVDGNVESDSTSTILRLIDQHTVDMLGMTVMPGPQMVAAMEARYVDFAVRGQGEDTLLELLGSLRGSGRLEDIRGLSYKDTFALHRHNP